MSDPFMDSGVQSGGDFEPTKEPPLVNIQYQLDHEFTGNLKQNLQRLKNNSQTNFI